MSMKSWTEPGYGVPLLTTTKNGKTNLDKIIKFIIKNGEYFLEDVEKIKQVEDEFELSDILDKPFEWVVAELINEKLGKACFKGYQSDGDTDQESMIGIDPVYSWNMHEDIDKYPKTKDEADSYFVQISSMLGTPVQPDYFNAEYFG